MQDHLMVSSNNKSYESILSCSPLPSYQKENSIKYDNVLYKSPTMWWASFRQLRSICPWKTISEHWPEWNEYSIMEYSSDTLKYGQRRNVSCRNMKRMLRIDFEHNPEYVGTTKANMWGNYFIYVFNDLISVFSGNRSDRRGNWNIGFQ